MSTKKEEGSGVTSTRKSTFHSYQFDMPPKKYSKIRYETRKELIRRVVKQKQTLISVAKDLGLKLSTSKFIVKSFKKQGRIFKKRSMGQDSEYSTFQMSETENKSSEPEAPVSQYFMYPQLIYNQIPQTFFYPNIGEVPMMISNMYFQNPYFN